MATSDTSDNASDLESAAALRAEFVLPTNRAVNGDKVPAGQLDEPCAYLCGNSLGALPKRAKALVEEELAVWGTKAVEAHFDHPHGRDWMSIADQVTPLLAELLGAKEKEVACMGGLTNNLHLMMSTFYKPTATRYKILCEAKAFPSDQYAFASQAEAHGLDPASAVLALTPRAGEYTLREEDILAALDREGSAIALVLFPGLQFYTGQRFPIQRITQAAKAHGCICGWDLAHAAGNVPVQLHDWDVDFAVWCSYKYLNAGPGAIAGLFIHEKWAESTKPKQAGWWGHDPATRFKMPPRFAPIAGAQGFQQSNPAVLSVVSLLGSLQVFQRAGMMPALRARSVRLTAHLETLLTDSRRYVRLEEVCARYGALAGFLGPEEQPRAGEEGDRETRLAFTILTPADPEARGAQLSLLLLPPGRGVMQRVFAGLKQHGVVGDEREPDVIRLAPAPLYNTLGDCERAAAALEAVFDELGERA